MSKNYYYYYYYYYIKYSHLKKYIYHFIKIYKLKFSQGNEDFSIKKS